MANNGYQHQQQKWGTKKMADNTPSIQEIEGRVIDPELGTGEPAVINDNGQLLNILNQNAQFKAANDWRKYQQFLGDYEQKLKTQQDIADLSVADSDRDWLKKESVSLFKDALSDPYKIYSPEFNSKLANIKANAVSSKQARDFAEKNAQWITLHPEFNTDENKAKIADFIDGQTVEKGGRKFFTLDAPDVFDYMGFTGDLKKDPSVMQTINESRVSPDKSLIYERQDTKYLRDPYLRLSEVSYETNPKVKRYAQRLFDGLSEIQKKQIGDPKTLWLQLAGKAFGSDKDILQQGKEQIQPNSNYLDPQRLAEEIRHNKAAEAISRESNTVSKKGEPNIKDNEMNPFASILTGAGGYSNIVLLEDLPASQVAAIKPSYIDKEGKLINSAKGLKISVGKSNGEDVVYLYDKKGRIEPINKSKLISNAQSWLAINAKEMKGQEVYGYDIDLYNKLTGAPKRPNPIEIKEDKLIFNGNEYTLKEVQDAGYKDFEDFKKNN